MPLFESHEVDAEIDRINLLYQRARELGEIGIGFLDLCFDGGDSVDEAEGLFNEWFVGAIQSIEDIL